MDDFGTFLQIYEFYTVFAATLKLPIPADSPNECKTATEEGEGLTWQTLERVLYSNDPTGPLGDVLMGLLAAIRRLEVGSKFIMQCSTMPRACRPLIGTVTRLRFQHPRKHNRLAYLLICCASKRHFEREEA